MCLAEVGGAYIKYMRELLKMGVVCFQTKGYQWWYSMTCAPFYSAQDILSFICDIICVSIHRVLLCMVELWPRGDV